MFSLLPASCCSPSQAPSQGFELKKGRFRSALTKKFSALRAVRPWPWLPREAVAAPSLAVFKARLDVDLSNLVWWKVALPMAGRLEPDDLQGPLQPKSFYDSMILWFYENQTTNAPKPTEATGSLGLKSSSVQDFRLTSASDSAPGWQTDINFLRLRALSRKAANLCALILKSNVSYKLWHGLLISNHLWTWTGSGQISCYF